MLATLTVVLLILISIRLPAVVIKYTMISPLVKVDETASIMLYEWMLFANPKGTGFISVVNSTM